ncbi:hypothetical protein F511_27797 [Dorcoceras hygrometricum]|uniref:Uncharacterized protein n=1 Tax=Dorcoceras hygrometricum TaxID=472368 RepID=A0A2Z7BX98_9LAMI|nr:hypothetical protein F511_27797 [Dorcoceras hygrometricum]
MTFIGCLDDYLAGNSCLAPTNFSRKPELHGLTRSAQTDSPCQDWPEQFPAREAAATATSVGGGGVKRGGTAACTRRPDEIGADGFSLSRLAGTISGERSGGDGD